MAGICSVENFIFGVLALEFGNYFFHVPHDGHVVGRCGNVDQMRYAGLYVVEVVDPYTGYLDLVVECGEGYLFAVEHFLVEFLSVAQSGELDFDVGGAAHLDHASCEVGYAHGLAHVEHEDLASVAHRSGFEHELAGFGYEHEVAYDVGVGDCDGASGFDLALEDGDDGAVGSEHVAEARGDKSGYAFCSAVFDGGVEGLNVDFADAFRAAHHVGGVDGFVGGYHDEFPGVVLDGEVGDDHGAVDVVFDAFVGVVLHHGDVLVGCGVEHVFGTVFAEYLFHAALVGDVGHDCERMDAGPAARHHEADFVEGCFGLIDEDEFGRVESGYLPHHFGADAAGGSGDENAFAAEQGADGFHVDLDFVARQEVFGVYFLELCVAEVALAVPFLRAGEHHDLDSGIEQGVDHRVVVAQGVALQRRDEKHCGFVFLHHGDELVVVGVDLHSHQVMVVDVGPVGYEALEHVGRMELAVDTFRNGDAALTHAVDEGACGAVASRGVVVERLDPYSRDPHSHERDQTPEHDAACAERHEPVVEVEYPLAQIDEKRSEQDCERKATQVDERGETQHALVGVEDAESDDVEHAVETQRAQHGVEYGHCGQHSEFECVGDESGGQQQCVVGHQNAPVGHCFAGEVPVKEFVERFHFM